MEQERLEQKLGYVERWEYLWDKFVLLLSAAKTAEQGDPDLGKLITAGLGNNEVQKG